MACWLGAIGLAAFASAPGAQPLPAGAEDCHAALVAAESTAEPGAEQLYFARDYCPAFVAALEASPWAATLPIDAGYLGSPALGALIDEVASYDPPLPQTLALDRLDAIVAGLEPFVAEPEPSLWQQIGDWIRGWLEGEGDEQTWLGRWLSSLSIPDSWTLPILYTIATLVVLTVLAIVINEIRLGGAFVGRTTRALRAAPASLGGPDLAPATIDAIRNEPNLGRKVELMLGIVVAHMRQRFDGLAKPSLTHRELARAAAGLDADARENLGRVADAAERVTYADWEPDAESAERVLASGEALIRRIDDDAGAPP